MKLKTPIKYNSRVRPVCLAKADFDTGTYCYVTGWGHTTEGGSVPAVSCHAMLFCRCSPFTPNSLEYRPRHSFSGAGGTRRPTLRNMEGLTATPETTCPALYEECVGSLAFVCVLCEGISEWSDHHLNNWMWTGAHFEHTASMTFPIISEGCGLSLFCRAQRPFVQHSGAVTNLATQVTTRSVV